MQIAAHRGYWIEAAEKNSLLAFERALEGGFGIETDLRDAGGEVVISHDIPRGGEMSLDHFLAMCAAFPESGPLALNIKADGLQAMVREELERHGIRNAFVFDMAVPDALGYLKQGIPAFTRISEYENPPSFFEKAEGVWLDAFHGEWYGTDLIASLLAQGKKVCIVSPELHSRPYQAFWQSLRDSGVHAHPLISLCTDFPQQAKEFFNA